MLYWYIVQHYAYLYLYEEHKACCKSTEWKFTNARDATVLWEKGTNVSSLLHLLSLLLFFYGSICIQVRVYIKFGNCFYAVFRLLFGRFDAMTFRRVHKRLCSAHLLHHNFIRFESHWNITNSTQIGNMNCRLFTQRNEFSLHSIEKKARIRLQKRRLFVYWIFDKMFSMSWNQTINCIPAEIFYQNKLRSECELYVRKCDVRFSWNFIRSKKNHFFCCCCGCLESFQMTIIEYVDRHCSFFTTSNT